MTMNAMKRLAALVLIATFLSLQVHPATFADDSDIFGADQKINIAHRVVNDFLTNVTGVRFGVMTFWYGNHNPYDTTANKRGAAMVAPIGTPLGAMKAAVNNVAADWDTPLGDALYDAG